MAGPSASAGFQPEQPQRFYLPDEEVESIADATLIVDGVQLPVHSGVLSVQSRVLRGLFVDIMSVDTTGGRKRKQPEEPVVLEQPFADCRLEEVAAFLRCAYCGGCLAGLPAGCLPGVLRLAHRLDAPKMMDAVSAHMIKAADSGTSTMKELLAWAEAGNTCHLDAHMDKLRVSCLAAVARQLAADMDRLPAGGDSLLSAITLSSLLEGCSQSTMLLLLSIMTASGSKPRCIPSKPTLGEALQRAPNVGAFEWALECFSEQPSAVGDEVQSPWFAAAGKEWRIDVCPGGHDAESAGHLSVFLNCKSAVRAKYKVTVIDQSSTGSAQHEQRSSVGQAFSVGTGWGWKKFLTLEKLRTRGYLANDRLVVRAEVEVVPK